MPRSEFGLSPLRLPCSPQLVFIMGGGGLHSKGVPQAQERAAGGHVRHRWGEAQRPGRGCVTHAHVTEERRAELEMQIVGSHEVEQ